MSKDRAGQWGVNGYDGGTFDTTAHASPMGVKGFDFDCQVRGSGPRNPGMIS